jgi:hypothetical protein
MTDSEYRQQWHEARRLQYEQGQKFINEIKPGDTVRIERYTVPSTVGTPYAMSPAKNYREKKTVKVYAVNNEPGSVWFTTSTGDVIEADSIIKWTIQPKQAELF